MAALRAAALGGGGGESLLNSIAPDHRGRLENLPKFSPKLPHRRVVRREMPNAAQIEKSTPNIDIDTPRTREPIQRHLRPLRAPQRRIISASETSAFRTRRAYIPECRAVAVHGAARAFPRAERHRGSEVLVSRKKNRCSNCSARRRRSLLPCVKSHVHANLTHRRRREQKKIQDSMMTTKIKCLSFFSVLRGSEKNQDKDCGPRM